VVFATALGFLFFWLIGQILWDLSESMPVPYADLEKELIDPNLTQESQTLTGRLEETNRVIARDTDRQKVLRQSTEEAQRTMNQILDFQRIAIDKGVQVSAEAQKSLAESQQIFLENQRRFQEINEKIARAEEAKEKLEGEMRDVESRLSIARAPVQAEHERRWAESRWYAAVRKLGFVLALLAVTAVLYVRGRSSVYAPVLYALGGAVVAHMIIVMNQYFPEQYFYYILVVAAIVVVLKILISLLQSISRPKPNWLLGQYRDAYAHFLCPVCEYPIRRGPLKYSFWTRRTASRLNTFSAGLAADEPYTCPMCATTLFETCSHCQGVRHSLLPACDHCGLSKPIAEIASEEK
jgi:predicted RNA-binding Zn-ribbon protein involved in translation (DUF1610 family)